MNNTERVKELLAKPLMCVQYTDEILSIVSRMEKALTEISEFCLTDDDGVDDRKVQIARAALRGEK